MNSQCSSINLGSTTWWIKMECFGSCLIIRWFDSRYWTESIYRVIGNSLSCLVWNYCDSVSEQPLRFSSRSLTAHPSTSSMFCSLRSSEIVGKYIKKWIQFWPIEGQGSIECHSGRTQTYLRVCKYLIVFQCLGLTEIIYHNKSN